MSVPIGPEDHKAILENLYRQLWGFVVYLGGILGKRPKECPHCGKPFCN